MKHILYFVGLLLLSAFTVPISAQAQVKDSYYFMKDDGEFSDEEKDEEALYIFEKCSSHSMQSVHFDCGCIAGSFRQQRDKGPLIPQNNLFNNLLNERNSPCINTVAIAGEAYKDCSEYAAISRARKKDNEEYCTCFANRVANQIKKNPIYDSDHIVDIKTDAYLACN